MTGKEYYEEEAQNWPFPTEWEELSVGAKKLWEERAKRISSRRREHNLEQGESL